MTCKLRFLRPATLRSHQSFAFSRFLACLVALHAGARPGISAFTASMLDRIAAIVNDGLVLKSELDAQMEAVTKRLQEQKVELPSQSVLRQQVLDRLILQEIQAQRAKRVGLTISDEQLNSALQEIAQRNKIPFDQLPTALEAQGVDYKQYRESMRKELTLEHPAPARRHRAHQRDAARTRPISRAPGQLGVQRRIQRIAHLAVPARRGHPAAAR